MQALPRHRSFSGLLHEDGSPGFDYTLSPAPTKRQHRAQMQRRAIRLCEEGTASGTASRTSAAPNLCSAIAGVTEADGVARENHGGKSSSGKLAILVLGRRVSAANSRNFGATSSLRRPHRLSTRRVTAWKMAPRTSCVGTVSSGCPAIRPPNLKLPGNPLSPGDGLSSR